MWQEFSTGLADNLTEVIKIIDDALCYGFEFKVEITNFILEKLHSYPHYQQSYPHQKISTKFKIKY